MYVYLHSAKISISIRSNVNSNLKSPHCKDSSYRLNVCERREHKKLLIEAEGPNILLLFSFWAQFLETSIN